MGDVSVQDSVVAVSGLRKRFGDTEVLRGVDLSVAEGRSLALIGPSGSGKTVLLKCLLGLLSRDGGEVRVGGVDPAGSPRAERDALFARVGMLFQRNALFDSMSNWENVAFAPMARGIVRRSDAREYGAELIRRVGLAPDTADLFPADLSGGMQKRVGLARALAGKPDILVLDNPTAGLDPILSTGIETLIREITEEQGATLIVVTADMERLTERYDDIAVLYDGVVQWAGPASRAEADAHPGLMQMLRGSREGPIRMRVRT